MPTPRRRRIVVAVVCATTLLAAACGDDSDDSETTSDDTTTSAPDNPTTTRPDESTTTSTGPDGSTAPDTPETPEDWVSVLEGLFEREMELWADPPNHDLTEIWSEQCECFEDTKSFFEDYLIANNYSLDGDPYIVHALNIQPPDLDDELPGDGTLDIMPLTVRVETGASVAVDAEGKPVDEPSEAFTECWAVTVRSDEGGPYYFTSSRGLSGCPDGWDWER